jgi:predicted unusual protein kinase regulating ubiquinone biosynthesis (AarF/ABC1/UbiB family)
MIKNDMVSPVKISNDRLMFTQSDMNLSNFGVNEQGKTVVMDFGKIGVLPETFVAHMMSTNDDSLAPIVSSLGLSNDSNASMARIRWYLGMVVNPKLGTST